VLELDTTHYKGNAPDRAGISAANLAPGHTPRARDWSVLLPPTRLRPDTPHRFLIPDAMPATHLRLDVYPDGGVARLRALGTLTGHAMAQLVHRWKETG
jgi:allantoicase